MDEARIIGKGRTTRIATEKAIKATYGIMSNCSTVTQCSVINGLGETYNEKTRDVSKQDS